MILDIATLASLVVAGGFMVKTHLTLRRAEKIVSHVIDLRMSKLLGEASKLEYDAKTIHKDATDALLEVRQLAQRQEFNHVQTETLLRQAEQVMNDPRVQHALRSSNG